LNIQAVKNWNRPDVFGVLTAAYSMLLGSSLQSGSSRVTSDVPSITVTKKLRDLLDLPAQLKSFTFCRFSLIPAIRKPVITGVMADASFDISSFLVSSLAEFASKLLEFLCSAGALPMSRAKCDEAVQDYQQMQKAYQEQQRTFQGQFRVSSESNSSPALTTDDISRRPDCMDDVIAFAVSVCALGSDFSLRFWSISDIESVEDVGINMELRPSLALQILCGQQSKDNSLRSVFLSFMSVLALAKTEDEMLSGSRLINELFTGNSNIITGQTENWASIFETLRHYVRELNPNAYSTLRSAGIETKASNVEGGSTSYYYFDDDNGILHSDPSSRLDQSRNLKARGGSKELGEENTALMLAHLAVIANVAKNCPGSRLRILSTLLPIHSPDQRDVVGHDDALNILFTLSIMPLRPEVRGAVFRTLASVLSRVGLSDEETLEMQLVTSRSWDLLCACQVVPTDFLGKYDSDRNNVTDARGINFPQSALALVSSRCGLANDLNLIVSNSFFYYRLLTQQKTPL
jgi:hypothetical protein